MKKNNNGTITLEASLVLPIFIFILLFMYGIMMFFSGRQLMSHAALEAGQSLAMDSYADSVIGNGGLENSKTMVNSLYSSIFTDSKNKEYFSSEKKWYEGSVGSEVKNRFWGYFAGGDPSKAKKFLGMIGIKGGASTIKFDGSYVDDKKDLHLVVEYEQQFIFNFGGNLSFPRKVEVVTHMWGLDEVEDKSSSSGGGSGSSGGGSGGSR